MQIASYVFLTIGGLFYLLGGLGILRMPDTLTRIQAGTKATTLGSFSLLLGVLFAQPSWALKIVIIIIFIILSNPIGSSTIARASYRAKHVPKNLVQDDFKNEEDNHELN